MRQEEWQGRDESFNKNNRISLGLEADVYFAGVSAVHLFSAQDLESYRAFCSLRGRS